MQFLQIHRQVLIQRTGPYKLWHHEHKLEDIEGGVLMTDIVTYIPPFGVIGAIANTLFIRKQLQEIFSYRTVALNMKFGAWPGADKLVVKRYPDSFLKSA